jgi:hypothetical protein
MSNSLQVTLSSAAEQRVITEVGTSLQVSDFPSSQELAHHCKRLLSGGTGFRPQCLSTKDKGS